MSALSDSELERYARQIVLPEVGALGQKRLKRARVAIVGAGGIGCAVIPALAASGIGKLTIIDSDSVDLTNLQRQPIFAEADSGRPKADLAAEFAMRLNRNVDAAPVPLRLDEANAAELTGGHDLVIDGSDNFATRLIVSDACVRVGLPLVSAAAVMFQGQVGLFRSRPCYRCFVGDAFESDDCDTCAEQGVLGPLPGTVGNLAALMALRAILGIGEDRAGDVHLFDAVRLNWRVIRIPPDSGCRACGPGAQ